MYLEKFPDHGLMPDTNIIMLLIQAEENEGQ